MTRELLKQALDLILDPEGYYPDVVKNIRAELAKPEQAPAWHDAPNAPGVWLFAGRLMEKMYEWRAVRIQDVRNPDTTHGRWFGPIPEDKT